MIAFDTVFSFKKCWSKRILWPASSARYKYCVTDVDEKNPRSVKSHLKTGFEILGKIAYGGNRFYVVIWDWRQNASV